MSTLQISLTWRKV